MSGTSVPSTTPFMARGTILSMNDQAPPHSFAHQPATLRLADREVRRLGYGAMRLPGQDV